MQLNIGDAKIILLCNSLIAVPAMRELLFYQRISAIIVPAKNREVTGVVKEQIAGSSVELLTVSRKDFEQKIKEAIVVHKPAAAIMMTFPYIISKEILSLPPKGFINFHYGKLPEYRGPEPIFTQIIKREKQPALTVHVVREGVDNGPVILQETVSYDENDTYGMLQQKMANAGARQVTLLMKIISFGNILPSTPQDESKAVYHKKPTAADLVINWQTMNSADIKALVNACNPWNKGCGAKINEQIIGITEVEIQDTITETYPPGFIIELNREKGLLASTCDKKIIKINIVYSETGFMSASRLIEMGLKAGDRFS
ncbi:MAG: hypothetical protein HOP10_02125 [Chitinophagaceae bacterium]|nr:hypothetical protein [Chitinophagaceae bacterium]